MPFIKSGNKGMIHKLLRKYIFNFFVCLLDFGIKIFAFCLPLPPPFFFFFDQAQICLFLMEMLCLDTKQ